MSGQEGRYRIGKSFRFEASHRLPSLPNGHKCRRGHGHSYQVEVVVTGQRLSGPGFVTDFADLAPFAEFLDAQLDHRNLNEQLPVEPTSENLARYLAEWFIENVEPTIGGQLEKVCVSETPSSWAEFEVIRR